MVTTSNRMNVLGISWFAVVLFYGQISRWAVNSLPTDSGEDPNKEVTSFKTVATGKTNLAPELPEHKKRFVPALLSKANWFRANQYCRFHGMQLASPESQEEEDQLISAMKSIGLNHIPLRIWTSGNDLASEGDFFWMGTGKMMTYQNWMNDEPNNFQNIENCVILVNDSSQLGWNDVPCTSTFLFACEYSFRSVTDYHYEPKFNFV